MSKKNKSSAKSSKTKKVIVGVLGVVGIAAVVSGLCFAGKYVFNKPDNADESSVSSEQSSEDSEEVVEMVESFVQTYTPNEAINYEFMTSKTRCTLKTASLDDKGKMCLEYELENIYVNDVSYDELSIIVFSGNDCESKKAVNEVISNDSESEEKQVIKSGSTVTVKASADIDPDGCYDIIVIGDQETLILKNANSPDIINNAENDVQDFDTKTENDTETETESKTETEVDEE